MRALVECVAQNRAADGLERINELVEGGADLRQLTVQLGELWRALLLARAGADVARILDCGADEARDLMALASQFSLDELTACANVFATGETQPRGLPVPQLGLELAFLQCVQVRNGPPAVSASPVSPHAPLSSGRAAGAEARPTPPPAPTIPTATPTSSSAAPEQASTPMAPPEALPPTLNAAPEEPAATDVDELDLGALDASPEPAYTRRSPAAKSPPPAPSDAGMIAPAQALSPADQPDTTPSQVVQNGTQPDGDDGDWLVRVQGQWELIKKVCKQRRRTVAALLQAARPIMASSGETLEIVLQAEYKFHLEKLREPDSRADVEWSMQQVLERPCHVRLVLAGSGGSDGTPRGGRGPAGRPPAPGGNGQTPQSGSNGSMPHRAGPLASGQTHGPSASAPQRGMAARAAEPAAVSVSAARGALRIAPTPEQLATADVADVLDPADALPDPRADVLPVAGTALASDTLEAEVRADPVIREIMRTYPAELIEVRPILPNQGH
jgi:DNA polymerase-3 subunit gamma/tau